MKRKLVLFPCMLVASLIVRYDAQAQAKPSVPVAPKKITSVEGITEYQLNNGLKVLLFPDPSKPTITVNITYLVGSRVEGYGETGMAHLLEHMVFKGSTKHKNIPSELTSHGASPNGTTSDDRTNYFETFAATDENLNWALDLESDRMVNSFIAEKDLKSEFSVVRNEFESGENNPSRILMERILSSAYLWHNYGKSTIGSKEDIEKVPIQNLQAFYKKYYQPDNAVLLVAGKIDEAKTLALVNKYFGKIPKPTRKLQPDYTVEPTQDGERFVALKRVGDIQSIGVAYHIPAGSHPDYPAFDVLNEVLTNEPNGRLYQSIVKTGMATSLWGYADGKKAPGYLYLNADVLKDRSIDSVKDIMFATFAGFEKKPVTDEEVTKAKNTLLKRYEQLYRNSARVGLILSEFIALGDWRLGFLYRDDLKKVKAEDVNRIAKNYLVPSNRTYGIFVPTDNPVRADIPAAINVDSLVKDYKGQQALAQGEAFDPSPANIDKRTKNGSLPGRGQYAFLAKETRGSSVEGRITLRMGDETSLQNKAMAASLTGSMLNKGTKTKTMAQINDALDGLSSTVRIFSSGQSVTLLIQSTKEKLPEVMKIVEDILKNPTFPDAELTTLKQERIAELEQSRSEPQSIAFNEFDRMMNKYPKGHIRHNMTIDEEEEAIKAITVADLRNFYDKFYNGSNVTAAFVGDFDEDKTKQALVTTFGSWKSNVAYSRVAEDYFNIPAEKKEFKTPDKKNAMFVAGMNMQLKDDNPDYPALYMGNFILGGGFLNSRLATRIRQKEGISYGVGSQISAGSKDNSGSFFSYAIYNPDNKAKLEAAWKEEIEKMVKEGFTEDEVKQAKTGIIQYRQTSRAQDMQLAGKLNSNLELGRTMQWDADLDEKLQKLTAAEINTAMKKYIDLSKISYVEAGDFK